MTAKLSKVERTYYKVIYNFVITINGHKIKCWKGQTDDPEVDNYEADYGYDDETYNKLTEEEQEEFTDFLFDITMKDLED